MLKKCLPVDSIFYLKLSMINRKKIKNIIKFEIAGDNNYMIH